MERITYRKTLDVHKNGVQFMLQGFETADNLSRVIEISLMASGDAIDFPLERMVAMMYVTTPNATEPSINECIIKDNKVVYEVLPIVEEGITTMQLKLIETSSEGATSVLAAPKFAVEVTKSDADDGSAEQSTTFTALEDAMAKAKTVYDERFLRMELSSDCIFRAYYADGTFYETDILKKLFHTGSAILSESFARGGTGVRAGEDTDNSMYYSNVSKSEALNAKTIMENSEEILEEVKLHGVYTAFSVDFETGNVEYVSPSFKFKINLETGELEVDGQAYTFEDELSRVVADWLASNGVVLSDLQAISTTHTEEIAELKETTSKHTEDIKTIRDDAESRLCNLEWTTLGAVTYSNSLTDFHTNDKNITATLTIPCDENILKQYTRFRFVIKTGSEFYCKGTYTDGGGGQLQFGTKITSGHNDIFTVGCIVYYTEAGEDTREKHILLEEDLICRVNISYCDAIKLFARDSSVHDSQENIIAIPSTILNVSMGYLGSGVSGLDLGHTTQNCSFTIELQGKR